MLASGMQDDLPMTNFAVVVKAQSLGIEAGLNGPGSRGPMRGRSMTYQVHIDKGLLPATRFVQG